MPGLQFLRSLALVCVTGLFFTGLGFVPLVDASAIMFLTPLLVTRAQRADPEGEGGPAPLGRRRLRLSSAR